MRKLMSDWPSRRVRSARVYTRGQCVQASSAPSRRIQVRTFPVDDAPSAAGNMAGGPLVRPRAGGLL